MDINGRGFAYSKFTDLYGMKCSIQESSLATDNAIWFGIDDPEPKVMAIDASSVGVKTEEITGWVPYPIPEIVCLHTRMHLNKEQVKALIPILQNFVETGELEGELKVPTREELAELEEGE